MLIVVSYLVYYENSLQNVTILLQNETAILLQNATFIKTYQCSRV